MPDMLKAIWSHPRDVERWLRRLTLGYTLNLCCGKSYVGDVRLDLDDRATYTLKGDVMRLPFRKFSFDTVICDPPFSYYNKFKWIYRISDLCKKRFMISTPNIQVKLKSRDFKRALYYSAGYGMFLRTYWVFDRINEFIDQE